MPGFRIEPFVVERVPPKRRPRMTYGRHLAFLRKLPCCISGAHPVEAAHIRTACRKLGKRPVGVSEKPDDIFALPLSPDLHRRQHSIGDEAKFWAEHGLSIYQVCALSLALFAASMAEDQDRAERIIAEHRLARGLAT